MAHGKRNTPELPTEAYQFAEIHHLGSPLKMFRAHVTDGLGCILAILGVVVALVPLGGFFYEDYTFTPMLLQVTGYSVGVFLLIASRNPLRHLSLIWFTVFSSVVHAGIMTAQALSMPSEHGHLFGDVPALFIVAALLAFLTPRGANAAQAGVEQL